MPHILVADKIAEPGLERLRNAPGVTYDVRHGLSPAELAEVVGVYDGMLIRSEVKVTAETLAKPGRLTAIARAGVGVDNVDLAAATAKGVLVLNTPDANTISTAEQTFALMLALHRHIPEAHQHVLGGEWKRSAFQGHQLANSTLGIIGFGRIGQAVARRALAFEMKVVVFDPFVTKETELKGDITLVDDLVTLLKQADCVTIHAALSDKTRHMIGPAQLASMKRGASLVNCARGALVDESALAAALNSGRLRGAAVDVYENEPPTGSPLLTAKNVVLSPHLAASTEEAQTRVSVDAVDALLAYLIHGEIRSAVNLAGTPPKLSARARAFVDLCARMGSILAGWCEEGVERVSVTVRSDSLEGLANTLAAQITVSVLAPHLTDRINLVNVRDVAKRRGIVIRGGARSLEPNEPESVTAVVETHGHEHQITATVLNDGLPRILAIDGYRMDLVPEGSMTLIFNEDRPGVIGLLGTKIGSAGINIADMAVSRQGNAALTVLKLDERMPDSLRSELQAMKPPINAVRQVLLPPAETKTEA